MCLSKRFWTGDVQSHSQKWVFYEVKKPNSKRLLDDCAIDKMAAKFSQIDDFIQQLFFF